MLRHDVAAQAYFQASAVAATVNGEKSYHYSMMQADERLVPVLAYSPIAVHSEFWLLQSQFAEACLARDFTNAELVLEKVQDRVASLSSGDQTDADELRTLVSELTASMVRIKSVSPQTSISS